MVTLTIYTESGATALYGNSVVLDEKNETIALWGNDNVLFPIAKFNLSKLVGYHVTEKCEDTDVSR